MVSNQKLAERVKELNCLNSLSILVEKHSNFEDIINGLLKIVPSAWQYPEITSCSIELKGKMYKSENFKESKWVLKQSISINNSSNSGSIKVFYSELRSKQDEGPFLKEERNLLNMLAIRLEEILEYTFAQDRLKLVLEGTGLGLWDWNPQTNEVTFDEQWAKMLGHQLSEIEFNLDSWINRVHPDDIKSCFEDIQKHIDGITDYYQNVHRMKHKNGNWVYIWDRGKIVERDADGKPTRFTGTHTDITKQKEAEIESIQAMKSREQFFALMSHEIRSPLGVLQGALETIKDEGIDQKYSELFRIIEDSSQLLKVTVDDILDFSKLKSQKIKLECISFNIKEIIDNTTRLFSEKCISKNIEITSIFNSTKHWFQGDPHRIRQILNNLISNAIKFTDSGTIKIIVCYEGNKLILKVKDSGIGISKDGIKHLFTPFFQSESSISRIYGGTGLGLYLSKEICCLMGGDLTVESELSKGSCFTAILALKESMPEVKFKYKEEVIKFSSSDLKSKILIVDDSKDIQQIIKMRLEKKGFSNLAFADNGEDAINYLACNSCNLILMDCMMPVLNGYQSATRLKKNSNTKSIPIIALTANASQEDYDLCIQSGMDDYLSKPINFEQLLRKMKYHL